jgi:hypothetical protein
MTILTYIALIGCLLSLTMGFATLMAERGYTFDLRGPKMRRRQRRSGGRRAEDLA